MKLGNGCGCRTKNKNNGCSHPHCKEKDCKHCEHGYCQESHCENCDHGNCTTCPEKKQKNDNGD